MVYTDTKSIKAGSPISVSAVSFTAQLSAQSVTTFVGSMCSFIKLGNLNLDGAIDALDLMAMKKHFLRIETIKDLKAADFDASGILDTIDFALLKQYLLRIIATFRAI